VNSMAPSDLVQRVSALSRCINAQDWEALVEFYAPSFRVEGRLDGSYSGAEEIARLRRELGHTELAHDTYSLNPLFVSGAWPDAFVKVEERLVRRWPDGCTRMIARQYEQHWRCSGGRWLLADSRTLPTTEGVTQQAALASWVQERLDFARKQLEPMLSGRTPPIFPRRVAGVLRRSLPSSQVTVGVDVGVLPSHVGEALRRASSAAMSAWNRSLHGVIELRHHSEPGKPDILIRGWNRPIYSGTLGMTLHSEVARVGRGARLAELRIAVVERDSPTALYLSPLELFRTISHELGHCFGLGECTHAGRIMGPLSWTCSPSTGPFLAERRAIIQWLDAAHSLLARAYRQLGRAAKSDAEMQRAAEIRLQSENEPPATPFPGWDLLDDTRYAPCRLQQYWKGVGHLSRGDFSQALKVFDRLLANGILSAEVLLRRACARWQIRDPGALEDLQRAVETDRQWLYARRSLVNYLRAWGDSRYADAEQVEVSRWTHRAKLEEAIYVVQTSRFPSTVGAALVRAGVCAAKYAAASLGRRFLAGGWAPVRAPSVDD
jgi:hypothetical protein